VTEPVPVEVIVSTEKKIVLYTTAFPLLQALIGYQEKNKNVFTGLKTANIFRPFYFEHYCFKFKNP
jgi:hypothetical protein